MESEKLFGSFVHLIYRLFYEQGRSTPAELKMVLNKVVSKGVKYFMSEEYNLSELRQLPMLYLFLV